MDEYGETLTPVNDARWWEAAVSQLEDEGLGEDDEEEEEEEDEGEESRTMLVPCALSCPW